MSLPPTWRDLFIQHAETDGYRAALADANERIAGVEYPLSYLAYSGGLDSLCCLDLCANAGLEFIIGHYDFGRPNAKASNVFPQWIEDEVMATARHYGRSPLIVTKRRNFVSESDAIRGREGCVEFIDDGEFWILGAQRVARELGCTCSIVGLRAQESIGRRKRTEAGGWVSSDMPEVWPVAQWSDMDRWAYVASKGLTYSRVYDEKAELNGSYMGLRMRSLFDDGRKSITDSSGDGVLFWRDRPRG
jgi:3'-phosphoadenosine 5'-phosphosulfate sulfotransferase (PAPS reductase)/FAD synthetase